jgi:phosphoribosyl-dephospho-CoA transferase
LPPFVLLRMLKKSVGLRGCEWGPTGSAGFELATGLPTITATSDLDLLIRAPRALSHEAAQALLAELQACASQAGARIDAQLDTPAGGVSLIEWAANRVRTMVKSAQGPYLIADPWRIRAVEPHGAPVENAIADQ